MKISIDKAKTEKLFYVVTNGVIFHPKTKRCLILQRSFKEKVHPGLWGVVGGKMEWSELAENKITRWNHDVPNWEGLVEESLAREAEEESGLKTSEPKYLRSIAFIRPDGIPVVLIVFALKYKSGRVKIPVEFENFAWVNLKEAKEFDLIEGIDGEIVETIKVYSEK
jgi:8-oxo-dGTP pyrophosphatase MutT (NUDIX family)